MTSPFAATAPPLGSLLRKAAVDAGFDLEPEVEGEWWRLRSSGVPGVAWVYPLPAAGALLALPLAEQLVAVHATGTGLPHYGEVLPAPPPGAAGAVSCPSPDALHAALRHVWWLRSHAPERLRARWEAAVIAALAPAAGLPAAGLPESLLAATEIVAEVRRRVGQELYREALLGFWGGQCAVTGLAVPELLRASHAKPWAVATDAERLDVYNGLLLAVHLDALFDRGLLAFDDAGRGVASTQLAPPEWGLLGVSPSALRLRRLEPSHLPYLAYHRAHVFRG